MKFWQFHLARLALLPLFPLPPFTLSKSLSLILFSSFIPSLQERIARNHFVVATYQIVAEP